MLARSCEFRAGKISLDARVVYEGRLDNEKRILIGCSR